MHAKPQFCKSLVITLKGIAGHPYGAWGLGIEGACRL